MRGLILCMLLMLLCASAQAEGGETAVPAIAEQVDGTIASLDLSGWQAAADEAGGNIDVYSMMRALARGETEFSAESIMELLRGVLLGEAQGMTGRLLMLCGPAVLWAISRQLSGRMGEAAGQICYLAGAVGLLGLFSAQLAQAEQTMQRISALTQEIYPVLTALMTAAGSAGTAGLVQPLMVLAGGVVTGSLTRIMQVFAGSAAILAVAGNLSGRISLKSLHRLCCTAASWLLGGVMTAFLGAASMCGVLGRAQDGMSIRAAKYAADHLLPVVGKEVAGTMDAMASGAALVRSAAGVTGMAVLIMVSLRPIVRLALALLSCRLCAALTEPAADGPLRVCAEQMARSIQILLAATAAATAVCLSLMSVALGGITG